MQTPPVVRRINDERIRTCVIAVEGRGILDMRLVRQRVIGAEQKTDAGR